MKKKILSILLVICVMVVMAPAMAFAADDILIAPAPKTDDIVILATSDVHCGYDDGIGYAGLAAYKKTMEAANNYVTLVDCGDATQGGPIGTLSKGEYLVEIMNNLGYEVVVPGNHEFDYGMDQFLNTIVKKMNATYVSANFVKDGKTVFDPYVIKTYGDKKVAFVGVCTPETFTKSTPTYFQNAKGEFIYGFCQGKGATDGSELYKAVQDAADAAKKAGADYVIALAHLGDDASSEAWTSSKLVANTTGIDAVIDGHAHQTFVTPFKNKAGKSVQVIATGTKLENIGKVTITSKGVIKAENITAAEAAEKDADAAAFIKTITDKYDALVKQVVAKTSVDLITHDADNNRLVRKEETNLGDLCADAYRVVLGADIGFANGGGVRAELKKGDITYGDIISVFPYGNMACVCEATGQQIVDALELGAMAVGKGESGGFLHVSGMTYTINPYIDSTVVLDENSMFVKVAGARKVSDVKVAGEPIDLAKTYTLACHNYKLKNCGDGFTMFKDNKFIQDEVMIDNQLLISYIQDTLKGNVGSEYAAPQGRIHIMTAAEAMAPIQAVISDTKAKLEIAEYECTLKATAAKKSVKLSWNACGATDVKYQVYKSTKKTSGFKKAITTSKTSYTAKSLTAGKTYYFKVRAIKTIGGETYYGHYSAVKSAKAK